MQENNATDRPTPIRALFLPRANSRTKLAGRGPFWTWMRWKSLKIMKISIAFLPVQEQNGSCKLGTNYESPT